MTRLDRIGLDWNRQGAWTRLDLIERDQIGLDWIGLEQIGSLDQIRLDREKGLIGFDWIGIDRELGLDKIRQREIRLDWIGLDQIKLYQREGEIRLGQNGNEQK